MMHQALPLDLHQELKALTETGLYKTEESILVDAVRTFFAARPDLRHATAFRLYEKGQLSLGRTADWAGISIEDLKEELSSRKIRRQMEEEPDHLDVMAQRALRAAGRGDG